jgi:beta-lactamase class A
MVGRLALLVVSVAGVWGCVAGTALPVADNATPTRVPNLTATRATSSPSPTTSPTVQPASKLATSTPGHIATPVPMATEAQLPTPNPSPELPAEATPTPLPSSCFVPDPSSLEIANSVPDSSYRLLAPTSIEQLPSFKAVEFHVDESLETAVTALIGDESSSYAVFIKDIASGRGASINSERVYYAASLFKLFVMYEVFHQQVLGLLDLNDELVMTPYYDSFGLGPRATSLCQRLTISEALTAMMAVSDNAAAILLQDRVGAPNVGQALASLGLLESRLTEELPVTAADGGLLLEAIARQAAVSAEASSQMLALMEGEEFDNGLRAGLPAEAALAHKTGNWEGAVHDAGIVIAPCGTYVIVVLSDNGYDPALTRQVSALAYDWCASGWSH